VSCDPEKVTGYVDDALEPLERAALDTHLGECPSCRQQVQEEQEIRTRLGTLPSPEPRPDFANEVRRRLAGRPSRAFWAFPLAASLAFFALWARGAAPFVAYELAGDHAKCFGHAALPAKVWSDDSGVITAWFEGQGTRLPLIPEEVAGLGLVGARYCPLFDRFVAHLYYTSGDRHASLFVLKGPARFREVYEGRIGAQTVLLFRSAGTTIGIVSERAQDAESFRRRFTTTMAAHRPAQP
jgi:anti-sigma factor RsiW